MKEFLIKNKLILGIFLIGIVLRLYNVKELFMYTHDHDLAGWFIKDILVNKDLRLIGQETSTPGIFIGPLFYYLLAAFYYIFGMDPIGGAYLVLLLGVFTIWSVYFVLSEIFDKTTGLIASFIYSISFYTVFNDREIVPTMPVILWSIWFLWGVFRILKKDQKSGLIILGILTGLIWHLNVALVILMPVAVLALVLSKEKLKIRNLLYPSFIFITLSLPLFLFELRHKFPQLKALITSLTTDQKDVVEGIDKLTRVIYLLSKNFSSVLWGSYFDLKFEYVSLLFLITFIVLIFKKLIDRRLTVIFTLWLLIYIVFFASYSKIVSEYYLNGTIIVFIAIISLGLSSLWKNKSSRTFAEAFLLLFAIVNIDKFLTLPVNRSGYVEKRQIISEIKKDSAERGYPCASISYITDPGYNLGYRYITWFEGLKLKPISNNVPVYTIVFPQKPVFKTDKDFGAIGLINPDYGKYNKEKVVESCKGDDFNLTDSMLGYN